MLFLCVSCFFGFPRATHLFGTAEVSFVHTSFVQRGSLLSSFFHPLPPFFLNSLHCCLRQPPLSLRWVRLVWVRWSRPTDVVSPSCSPRLPPPVGRPAAAQTPSPAQTPCIHAQRMDWWPPLPLGRQWLIPAPATLLSTVTNQTRPHPRHEITLPVRTGGRLARVDPSRCHTKHGGERAAPPHNPHLLGTTMAPPPTDNVPFRAVP